MGLDISTFVRHFQYLLDQRLLTQHPRMLINQLAGLNDELQGLPDAHTLPTDAVDALARLEKALPSGSSQTLREQLARARYNLSLLIHGTQGINWQELDKLAQTIPDYRPDSPSGWELRPGMSTAEIYAHVSADVTRTLVSRFNGLTNPSEPGLVAQARALRDLCNWIKASTTATSNQNPQLPLDLQLNPFVRQFIAALEQNVLSPTECRDVAASLAAVREINSTRHSRDWTNLVTLYGQKEHAKGLTARAKALLGRTNEPGAQPEIQDVRRRLSILARLGHPGVLGEIESHPALQPFVTDCFSVPDPNTLIIPKNTDRYSPIRLGGTGPGFFDFVDKILDTEPPIKVFTDLKRSLTQRAQALRTLATNLAQSDATTTRLPPRLGLPAYVKEVRIALKAEALSGNDRIAVLESLAAIREVVPNTRIGGWNELTILIGRQQKVNELIFQARTRLPHLASGSLDELRWLEYRFSLLERLGHPQVRQAIANEPGLAVFARQSFALPRETLTRPAQSTQPIQTIASMTYRPGMQGEDALQLLPRSQSAPPSAATGPSTSGGGAASGNPTDGTSFRVSFDRPNGGMQRFALPGGGELGETVIADSQQPWGSRTNRINHWLIRARFQEANVIRSTGYSTILASHGALLNGLGALSPIVGAIAGYAFGTTDAEHLHYAHLGESVGAALGMGLPLVEGYFRNEVAGTLLGLARSTPAMLGISALAMVIANPILDSLGITRAAHPLARMVLGQVVPLGVGLFASRYVNSLNIVASAVVMATSLKIAQTAEGLLQQGNRSRLYA